MKVYTDLTLTLESGMHGVNIDAAREINRDGWNATTLQLYSHCGTHIDAPLHFNLETEANSIDLIPVERYFADAWIVDLPNICGKELIHVSHLGLIAQKVQKGDGLIFRTGWSKFINSDKYRNDIPGLSDELASWCVEKQISVIGVEPPSIADVNNIEELTRIHNLILGAGIIVIEGLTNLDNIKSEKIQLVALPLKIKNGDGSPARVIAIEYINEK